MASVATLGFSIISRYSGHGVTQARRDLATLRAQMATLNDDLNSHTKILNNIPARWQAIGAAVAAVGPSLIPLAAQATQVAASFTAMSAAVGVSLGAYALSVKNAIDTTNGMAKAGKKLSADQKDFIKQQDALNKAFSHFGEGFRDLTLKGISDAFEGAARGLTKLQSVAKAITPEINRVAAAFNAWTKSASFDNYIKLIGAAAPVAFRNLSDAARIFFNVIGDGFRAFLPSGVKMTQTIKDGAAALKSWSDGGGFQRFLEYVRSYGPQLNAFWDQFRAALKNLFVIIEQFSAGSMDNLTDALRGIATLDPGAVKAFASSLLLMKSPLLWLVINCPPLRDMIISILGSLNAQTVYAMAAAFTAWRVAILLVNAGLISSPIGLVITAIAALGVAIVYIATKTTWFQTAWQYTWNFVKTVAEAVWGGLTVAFNAFVGAMVTAWNTVSGALVTAWNTVWSGMSTAVQAVWTGLTTAWNAVVSGLTTAWTTVSGALVTAWNAVWSGLSTAAQAVWSALTTAWNAFTSALSTAWTTVSGALVTAWNAVWTGLSTAAQAVWSALTTAWNAFTSALATAWTTVSGALTAAWNAVWTGLKTAAQAVWTAMQTAWQAFLTAVQTVWTTVSGALSTAWNATWTAIKTAAQAVWTAMQTAWQAFGTALNTIWTTVSTTLKAAWSAVWTAIKTAGQTVWDAMKVAWQAFGTALNTIWTTVSNALKTAWNAVWTALKTTAQTIWDAIKTAWQTAINWVKTKWDEVATSLKAAWKKDWDALHATAVEIWDKIKKAVKDGIDGLLTPVNLLIKGFNAIAKAVSLDIKIPEISVKFANGGMVGGTPVFAAGGTVNFAKGGGALSGYSPGRDTVPAMLSRGEGVLTPEAMRGIGGPGVLNSLNRKFAGHRGAGRGAKPLHFADGGTVGVGGARAWHRGTSGWGFALGGLPSEIPAPDPANPTRTAGTVGQTPKKNEGGDDGDGSPLDILKGLGSGILGQVTGGLLGDGGVASMVLGFIGKEAFDKALMPLIDKITGNFGPVGEILSGAAKKVGHGLLDFLIKKDAEKKKEFESMAVAGAQSVAMWAELAKTAMIMGGLNPAQLPKFLALMSAESSGNPNAINTTDINAKNGIPSQGLMQITPPNFVTYHVAGTSNNILDPLANMAASANYILHVYGGNVPGSPYALGTPGATAGTHLVGENGPELVNFRGGESVTPAPATSRILAGMGTTGEVGSGTFGQDTTGIQAALKDASFQEVTQGAQQMAAVVKQSWTKVVGDSTTGWQTLTPVLGEVTATQGTTVPAAFTAMDTANSAAWTNINATSAAQWGVLRDGTMLEANTMLTETVPASTSTMQAASDSAWTSMATNSESSWATMDAASFTPFQGVMTDSVPAAAGTMNTEVSGQSDQMSSNIQSAVSSSEPPLQSLISTMGTALSMSASLAAGGGVATTSGGGGMTAAGAAALAAQNNDLLMAAGYTLNEDGSWSGTGGSAAVKAAAASASQYNDLLMASGYKLLDDGSWKAYAKGTDNASKGLALVGEQGPELLNFAGGETVTPAAQTSSILSGMGSTAPAMPALPDVGGMMKKMVSGGGSSDDVVAQLQAIIEAAQQMQEEVKAAWTGVNSATQTGQSTMNPILAALIAQYGTNVPAALTAMSAANTTTWTTMGANTNAQWVALQAAVITPAKAEMTTAMPLAMSTMATANTTHWTEMSAATAAQWTAMKSGPFTEANTEMVTNMPEWGNQMNSGVSQAWQNMGEATATAWEGMKEGTRGPTNWIIENSYNNGLARLWNEVAAIIFEDGAKTLPTVATLAKGGPVHGPGGETADRVPAMLSRGEHVWTAKEVHRAGGHRAVQQMRAGVMGRNVRGGVDACGMHAPGFALGGWLGGVGNVGGGLSLPGLEDLKRGSLMDKAEPFLDALDSGVKGALAGSAFRKMGGSAGALSPSDWMRQYIKKDDELNKIGSGGPPWIPGVSDVHVSYDGYTVNQRTADMLDMAKQLGASFSLAQGSFSSGVAASAGTHDGGGVVDVVPAGDSNVGPLRGVGFAAWNRGAAYGSPSFAEHIHAVALGDPTVSPAAADQIQSYLNGGNGLADGGPDNYSGGIPDAAGVGVAGGGRNVDPKDLTQGVVSFDSGGLLQPGYTLAFNGTRKPEPVGHNLEPKGSHHGDIKFEIHTHGSATAEDVVAGINNEVLPKLRQYLNKGTGSNG